MLSEENAVLVLFHDKAFFNNIFNNEVKIPPNNGKYNCD